MPEQTAVREQGISIRATIRAGHQADHAERAEAAEQIDNKDEFYLLVLIAALGGILLANANHLASLFLGIELISLPLFGLVGYAFRQKRSLEASIKYTILSAAASSFLLFGMALVYAQSGDLSFVALGKNLGDGMLNEPLLLAGFGLMIVGLGFKLSLVPFHLWTPDVYQGAPAPVSTFLATASKIAIFGVVMRLFLYAPVGDSEAIRVVLAIIAFASIIFGNLMALSQTNIKRLLGYSSISHLGYLLVALIALQTGEMSMEAVGVYLAGFIAFKPRVGESTGGEARQQYQPGVKHGETINAHQRRNVHSARLANKPERNQRRVKPNNRERSVEEMIASPRNGEHHNHHRQADDQQR